MKSCPKCGLEWLSAPGGKYDAMLNQLVRRSLVRSGKVIPQTEEEVALFEQNMDLVHPELPKALRDPWACLDPNRRKGPPMTLTDAREHIARLCRDYVPASAATLIAELIEAQVLPEVRRQALAEAAEVVRAMLPSHEHADTLGLRSCVLEEAAQAIEALAPVTDPSK